MVPKGADDSDMMTYYNNNGDYIDWTPVANSTGANADKGKWKDYSRTVSGGRVTAWHFFSQGEEILDDVELWVYPANGFILRPELGSDEGEMVKIDDGLDYTFPAVADKFASATGTVWTDGTNLFNAGDVVTASALHGKVIYVYDGGELSTYNPTPVPPQKMDKTMGDLVAFFNFDSFKTGSTNKYPTYWKANIVLDSTTAADYITPYGTIGTTDVVVSDAAMPSINGGSLKFVRTGTANPWPTGKQSIRFKIFVPADGADSTLKVKFNSETAVDVAAEANADKGTWKEVCVTAEGTSATSWEFIGGSTEIIDDVEIWVFSEDAYIVEESKGSDNFQVLHCTTEIFTFPAVADTFASATGTVWTDGSNLYNAGDVVTASQLHGKIIYVYGGEELITSNPTPVPEKKLDDVLGELAAFFNFDNEDFKTPTYAKYAVKVSDSVNDEALLGPADDSRFPSNVIDLALAGKNGTTSNFEFVSDANSENPWPAGRQTIKMKVMVRCESETTGSTRTFYDGNSATYAYTSDAFLASGATSGANSNRDEWRSYSRSTPENALAGWSFFCLTSKGVDYTKELVDDVEIWCYPSNGFIIREAADSDNGQMIRADGNYSFPTVKSVFPDVTNKRAWTDGTAVYEAGTSVSASELYGKTFYPVAPAFDYNPTPVPAKKVDDTLGELVAFFNFDGENFKAPTYAKYAVKISDSVNGGVLTGPSDDARFQSYCVDFEKLTGVHAASGVLASPFNIVKDLTSELPEWPDGVQTVKLQVMARSERPTNSTRIYYNGNAELAFQTESSLTAASTSGANANRDEWRTYSRTTEAGIPGTWNFLHYNDAAGIDGSYVHEVIDDIEIWVYPANGFILRPESGSDDGEMIRADGEYTFPSTEAADKTAWTDGTSVYEAGTSVSASDLYGKTFYPCEKQETGGNENDPTITVSSATDFAGETVDIAVSIEKNSGILGATLKITFGSGLTLVGASNGDAFSPLTMTKPGVFGSPCNFVWDGQELNEEDIKDGTILNLQFKISDNAKEGDEFPINVSYTSGDIIDGNLEPVSVNIVNGKVSVISFNPGDLNNDGSINTTDVILLRRHIAGGYNQTIIEEAADVNNDGNINTTDVILIRRYIAGGYDVELQRTTYKFGA